MRYHAQKSCYAISVSHMPLTARQHLSLVRRLKYKWPSANAFRSTSTLTDNGDYVPISPTPKKGYPIQLRLRNYREGYHRDAPRLNLMLPKYSYLKIDADYEVPIQMLVKE